jgi:hypothetical protein
VARNPNNRSSRDAPAWRLFEDEVRLLAQEFEYRAETTQSSGDGGIDVLAHGSKGKVIIQCKLFSRGKVGGPTISQLAGTCLREKADHAICITTSGFTKQAIAFAEASGVLLLDGKALLELCQRKGLTLQSLTALQHRSGEQIPIPSPQACLGRALHCTITITDPTVSRQHAILRRDGLRLFLQACGSTNGSFINGERVHGPRILRYGDWIKLGDAALQVVLRVP